MRTGIQCYPMSVLDLLNPSFRDESQPPGEDFFRFASGGWLDANPVPPEYGSWGSFHEVQLTNENLLRSLMEIAASDPADETADLVGRFYASGMATDQIEASGIDSLRSVLADIDGLRDSDDLYEIAARLHPIGVSLIFGLYVAPDFENSDRNLLYLGQGGLGLPERDYYLRDDQRSRDLRIRYRDHIVAQLINLGIESNQAQRDADSIINLEKLFAEESYTASQLRDVDLTTNKVSVGDCVSLMEGFSLSAFFEAIGASAAEAVNLDNPGFFSAVGTILSETSVEVLRAYSRWHVARSFASALPENFENEEFEFYGKALSGQQRQKERWRRVLAAATSEIGESVSRLYVESAFSPEAKARCELLVDGLIDSMRRSIEALTWMGENTKQEALIKLNGFTYKIGYPDLWQGTDGLEISATAPWVSNRMAARVFKFRREIEKLGRPVDDTEWAMPAHVVNAYYHPLRNEIVFPAGILQPPFFYSKGDDALNYGAIGSIIGHEITHGFDDQGSRFDANGHLREWWAEEDRAEFERRANVVVAQFDAYEIADDLTVNGRLTLGENIADLGGISIAFRAFNRVKNDTEMLGGFTPAQRFFLSYGTIWRQNYTDEYLRLLVNTDPHSPTMFRCNGALANLPAFAQAFGLSESSPMVRGQPDRAEIW